MSAVDAIRESRGDLPIGIATLPANARHRRAALTVIALLAAGIVITAPIATVQVGRVDAFIPVLQTVLCFAELITASLLFAQYAIQPQRSLLALAGGYICSGSFAFLQTLAFPGGYAPEGLFGDGVDTPAWFFIFWHALFLSGSIVYGLLKGTDRDAPVLPTWGAITFTIAFVLALVAAISWGVIAGAAYLPTMYFGGITAQTSVATGANLFLLLLDVIALWLVFARRRSILDTWLTVTLFAWLPNFLVAALIVTVRFSLGWYVARGYALVASCIVLIVLLTETTLLYGRLASAIALLWRERVNRLVTVDAATAALAHEIRQPLTGISSRSAAALNWLRHTPPELEKVQACLQAVIEASHRVDQIISGVRGMTRRTETEMTAIDINDLVREVLALAEHDLQVDSIRVRTRYEAQPPMIMGNRTLLQQVVLNLIRNAIDAMAPVDRRRRSLRLVTAYDRRSQVLKVTIADSGRGVPVAARDRIFDTFFTTKPTGMGLGLAICRTTVEEHGGKLRLAKTDADGSTFEISLPVVPASEPRDQPETLGVMH